MVDATTTTTQTSTASLNQRTNSPPSGDDTENKALSSDYHNNHVAATTTEYSNSFEASTQGTDKDSWAYVEALLSAIEALPTSDDPAAIAAAAALDSIYHRSSRHVQEYADVVQHGGGSQSSYSPK
jgi:hypothetical protein